MQHYRMYREFSSAFAFHIISISLKKSMLVARLVGAGLIGTGLIGAGLVGAGLVGVVSYES
jgi:hypothetical protein